MSTPTPNPPAQTSIAHSLRAWGNNSLNPLFLATLTTPQHLRPLRPTGLIFTPTLVFTSYTSMHGYKTDAAGLLLAQSALYLLLSARRRSGSLRQKFMSARGAVRGATMALCALDIVAAGLAYVGGDRAQETRDREAMRLEWAKKGQ